MPFIPLPHPPPEDADAEILWFLHRYKDLRLNPLSREHPLVMILSYEPEGKPIRWVVPASQRDNTIQLAHTRGHWGITKTVKAIEGRFVWPGWRAEVSTYIHRCVVCLQRQKVNLKDCVHVPRVSHRQGEVVYMDLVGPISPSISKYRYILTLMDGFSRYVKTVPLRTKTAREVAEAVLSGWIKGPGGIPERFQGDRGTEFTAMIAQAMYSKLGVHFQFGHSDNHQSNPLERFHRTLWSLIRNLRAEGEDDWVSAVETAAWLYNQSRHSSTGFTPNKLFLGRENCLPTDLFQGAPAPGPEDGPPDRIVAKLEWEAAMVQKAAQDNAALAVMRNTAYYTNLARAIGPGDLVFCWSESVSRGADPINNRKLKLKWSGPYVFVRHVNSVMVEVGQIVSKKGGWKNQCFTVHITKVRLYKREGEKGPIRDPKDLPAFVPEDMEDLVKHADSIISFRSGPSHLPRGAGEEDQALPRGVEGGPPRAPMPAAPNPAPLSPPPLPPPEPIPLELNPPPQEDPLPIDAFPPPTKPADTQRWVARADFSAPPSIAMSEEDLAGPPPYDSASAVNEPPVVPVTYKPLTKKGLSTLGRGTRVERARMEERNTQQEIRQGARQRSRTVNRLAAPRPLNQKPLSAEMLRDRSPRRVTEGGVGAERSQRRAELKEGSSVARTARYLTDAQPPKQAETPKAPSQGQGNPPDNRAGPGAEAPYRPASPHCSRRQAQARLKHRPAPYTPPVKRVAPPPPPPSPTEEAPVEAGRRNPSRVAKQEALDMFRAQAGNFSSDSDHKPPAPRPRRRRGGRSRSEKRDRAETERVSADHLSPPEKRRTVTPETTEKEPKEYQPSAPQLSEAEEEDGEWVPIEAAETESPASASCPSESGHVAGVGGGGKSPLSTIKLTKKRGHNSALFANARKKDRVSRNLCPIFFRASAATTIVPKLHRGGQWIPVEVYEGGGRLIDTQTALSALVVQTDLNLGWIKKGLRIGKFSSYRRETQSAAIFVQVLSDALMLQVPAGTRLGALNLTQRSHLARAVTGDLEDPPPSHQGASCSSQC